jgi:hypothetical protein
MNQLPLSRNCYLPIWHARMLLCESERVSDSYRNIYVHIESYLVILKEGSFILIGFIIFVCTIRWSHSKGTNNHEECATKYGNCEQSARGWGKADYSDHKTGSRNDKWNTRDSWYECWHARTSCWWTTNNSGNHSIWPKDCSGCECCTDCNG